MKCLVAKRTKDYALIKLAFGISVIVSAKFIRAKETEDTIFISLPEDYMLKWRKTRYSFKTKKYEVVDEDEFNPYDFKDEVLYVKGELEEGNELKDILSYDYEEKVSLPESEDTSETEDDNLPF